MGQNLNHALETLFYPFTAGPLAWPDADQSVAFFNAQAHPALQSFSAKSMFIQQYFKPYAQDLEEQGFKISSELPQGAEIFDTVFVLIPKNQIETTAFLATGLKALKPGGLLIAAGDNKAGAARLVKTLQALGCKDVQNESKNKARVVWARKEMLLPEIEAAIKAGAPQEITGDFYSWPGLFGWDKIDQGSEILAQHLPPALKGQGADFGCGYGYLALAIMEREGVQSLACIDADYRALIMCRKNFEASGSSIALRFFWEDLTQRSANIRDLDFIVMNPPFHEGKTEDADIGRAFIESAHQALRPDGWLWMVANARLPYEQVLQARFQKCEKKFEDKNFKVYAAQK